MSHQQDHPGQLTFYLTHPAPCPYLPGQVEQKIFTRLEGPPAADFFLNSAMNQHGFRRSQSMVYRPACPSCMACVPVRIALERFSPTRRLRRIARANNDLTTVILPVDESRHFFDLFRRYQMARHAGGDMAQMGESEFRGMMQEGGSNSYLLTLQNSLGVAQAVMLVDKLHNGGSAVYSFYETQTPERSLGTALILRLINELNRVALPYAYLGYWVKEARKMAYKAGFPALERLTATGWEAFIPEPETAPT